MKNFESSPLQKFNEKVPEKKHLEEDSLENKFIVKPDHLKNIEDNNKADALLKKITSLPLIHEDSLPKIKDSTEELTVIYGQSLQARTEKFRKVVTNVTDFVPVIGSIKMILEGWNGKQYGTENEIKGAGRVVHTISGVVFLGLDLTGVGVIASEFGKGVIKIGERVAVRTLEERLARKVVEKEVLKLTLRGHKRIEKKEKIEQGA